MTVLLYLGKNMRIAYFSWPFR